MQIVPASGIMLVVLWFLLSIPTGIVCGILSIAFYPRVQTWLARRSVRRRAKRVRRIRANVALADEMRLYASVAVGGMGLLALGMIIGVGFDVIAALAGVEIMLRYPAGAFSAPPGTRLFAAFLEVLSLLLTFLIVMAAGLGYRLFQMLTEPKAFKNRAVQQLGKLGATLEDAAPESEPAAEPAGSVQAEPGTT